MLFFLIFFSNSFVDINGQYICSKNVTVFLKFNELAFFQTPNYPALNDVKPPFCYITFKLKDGSDVETNYRAVTGTTSGSYFRYPDDDNLSFDQYFDVSLSQEYSFSIFDEHWDDDADIFISEQGFVVFDNGKDNCPLESACNPFIFENEMQVIYINSDENYNLSDSCKWEFIAPPDYGFKIVIMFINPASEILIINSTDTIVNKRSTKLNHPYYNSDSYIQILWFNIPQYIDNVNTHGISISVSIVKKEFNYIDISCPAKSIDNETIIWSNIFNNGLNSYSHCTYNLTIPENFTVLMQVQLSLEANVDILQYYRSENDIIQISNDAENFLLEPNYDGFERNIVFEFISDGSISSMGFALTFIFMECKCQPSISCDGFFQTIMSNDLGHYCGNLNCLITIEPCITDYGLMQLFIPVQNVPLLDVFKVFTNDELVFSVDASNQKLGPFSIFLNSSNINVLEAITHHTFVPNGFLIKYETFDLPPADLTTILSPTSPYIILDLNVHILSVIKVADKLNLTNLTLFVYYFRSVTNDYITIFNNQSLTYNLNGGQKCFQNPYPFKCEIKSHEIALYETKLDDNGEFAAVRLSDTYDGCAFSETIFCIPINGSVTALSNSKGTCDVILLIDGQRVMTHIFTTATTENVKVYIGLDKKRLYFEFNSITAKMWKNIGLFSRSYIIKIPKNSSLLIYVESAFDVYPFDFPYKSLITTNDFATTKRQDYTTFGNLLYTIITKNNERLKFTALYYNISSTGVFYFKGYDIFNQSNPNYMTVHKIGDSIIFHNKIVEIHYNHTLPTDEVMLFVETIV